MPLCLGERESGEDGLCGLSECVVSEKRGGVLKKSHIAVRREMCHYVARGRGEKYSPGDIRVAHIPCTKKKHRSGNQSSYSRGVETNEHRVSDVVLPLRVHLLPSFLQMLASCVLGTIARMPVSVPVVPAQPSDAVYFVYDDIGEYNKARWSRNAASGRLWYGGSSSWHLHQWTAITIQALYPAGPSWHIVTTDGLFAFAGQVLVCTARYF